MQLKTKGKCKRAMILFISFGGTFSGGRRGERMDNDLNIKLRVTLKDLYLGKEYEVIFIFYLLINHFILVKLEILILKFFYTPKN